MSGFVVIHRAALDHPLFKGDPARLGAWCWLIANACWKPTRFNIQGRIVTIERGQICASRHQLAEAWGWSESGVERFLTRLKTEQMIGRETGQGKSVITICNYAKYQDVKEQPGQASEQETGQPSDSHRTAKEQGNKGIREPKEDNAKALSCETKPKRRASRCPDDWQPKPLPAELAASVDAMPPGWIERQLAGMRDWSKSSPNGAKMDWDATWRGWVRRELEKVTSNAKRLMDSGTGKPAYRRSHGLDMLRELRAEIEADEGSQGVHHGAILALPLPARY